jgi:hypothetical protein
LPSAALSKGKHTVNSSFAECHTLGKEKHSAKNFLPSVDEDYNLDPNMYDREFFQEEGLEGRFEIDLTEAIGTEVEMVVDEEEEEDEVQNAKDLQMLEALHLGNVNDDSYASDNADYDMVDSDDETYDPANPDDEDYF